jgi:tetratricopeptide (TPR) repeat protein
MHRLLLLLVFACAHPQKPTLSGPGTSHVAKGNLALEKGELDRAEAEFAMALEYDPQTKEALNGLGLVTMARGDHDSARGLFQAALVQDDDFAEAHANGGALELASSQPDLALPHLQAALAIDPGFVAARHNLARALVALGRFDEAREEYMKLTSTQPSDADAWAELAHAELLVGHRAAAGRAANVALGLAPSQPIALRVHADLLRDGGDLAGALQRYDALLAQRPSDEQALVGRGMTLLLMGRLPEARADMRRAVDIAPGSPLPHFGLAVALLQDDDDAGALVQLEAALSRARHAGRAYPEARYLYACAMSRLGRRPEALREYRAFIDEAKASPDLASQVEDARAEIDTLQRRP